MIEVEHNKRIEHLTTLATQVGSILAACEALQAQDSYLAALRDDLPRPDADSKQQATVRLALEQPLWDPIQLANELRRRGVAVRPTEVQALLRRRGLHRSDARLATLVSVTERVGLPLDSSRVRQLQLQLVDRHQQRALAQGAGACCFQDTYHVGVLERVGSLYQQTFIDLATGEVSAKIYTEKKPRVAVDLLEERVLDSYRFRGIRLRRIFTDRGTEYCGDLDVHLYERALRELEIEHCWLQYQKPQHNPVSLKVHQQLHQELYGPLLLAGEVATIYDLQRALDEWLKGLTIRD